MSKKVLKVLDEMSKKQKTEKNSKELSRAELNNGELGASSSLGEIKDFGELMSILGRVFTRSHSYRQPDVYQVVGWTKNSANPDAKRRFVFVRSVNFNSNNHMHGGDGTIDATDVQTITEPQFSGNERLTLDTYTTFDEHQDYCLRKRKDGLVEEFFPENDLNRVYMWCDY